jgi:hypothetical protein
MGEVGIRVYRMPSSPITTAIKKAWRWCRLRCCMVVGVELHCFGVRLENGRCLGLIFCKKPRSKFIWLGRTCELYNPGRRDTPIIGEESWVLKCEILCTSRCHLWGVCVVSRSEASSHRGSLDHSRFWKHQRGLLETRRLGCARCNEVTTQRKKLLGKEKKNWRRSFQVSFLICPNLEDEIYFKGGGDL